MTGIPEVIRGLLDKAVDSATNAAALSFADSLSNLIFNIIGFLIVAMVIKLALFLLTLLFSRRKTGIMERNRWDFRTSGRCFEGRDPGLCPDISTCSNHQPVQRNVPHGSVGRLRSWKLLVDNNLILGVVKGFL